MTALKIADTVSYSTVRRTLKNCMNTKRLPQYFVIRPKLVRSSSLKTSVFTTHVGNRSCLAHTGPTREWHLVLPQALASK